MEAENKYPNWKFPVTLVYEEKDKFVLEAFWDTLKRIEKEKQVELAKVTLLIDAYERGDFSNVSGQMLREMMRDDKSIKLLNQFNQLPSE